MKKHNKLYMLCNTHLGRSLEEHREIRISFGLSLSQDIKEVRRNHVNELYFNVVNSLLGDTWSEDLRTIISFVRINDRDGVISKKLDDIFFNIQNGESE